MAGNKCKGTPLKVFSGKEGKLNRIILLLVLQRVLTKHDVFLEVRRIKGCRHKTSGTVGRRMNALCEGGFLCQQCMVRTTTIAQKGLYAR